MATPTTPTSLVPPLFFQPPSPTTAQQQHHKPSIIWFVPADKRLPLVAVPVKHAPYGFLKYHEEFRHRIFIVRLVALIYIFIFMFCFYFFSHNPPKNDFQILKL